jgi:cytoskeletal protein CcmA (bactofilin family)
MSSADYPGYTEERRSNAWIGTALTIQGRIISSQDLTIDGRVEGTIELGNHGLTVGSGAEVKADLAAQKVTISGTVTGNVTATDIVDLRATGSVEGDIVAPRLIMADGAIVRGRVDAAGKRDQPVAARTAESVTSQEPVAP